MSVEKLSLAAKLARIGKEIGAVDKSGRNSQQNYAYIEYGVVAGRIRELFDTYGIIIVPCVEDYSVDEISNKYGNKGYHYALKMSFKIINGDDKDDYFESKWMGESADYGDKGINKAETSGTKYFLMRLFNVSEKGEEEADKNTPEISETVKMAAKTLNVNTESEFTQRAIDEAKEKLKSANTVLELKSAFITLGKIRNLPEIVALKNEIKEALAAEDEEVKLGNAKDAIDNHFGKDE